MICSVELYRRFRTGTPAYGGIGDKQTSAPDLDRLARCVLLRLSGANGGNEQRDPRLEPECLDAG